MFIFRWGFWFIFLGFLVGKLIILKGLLLCTLAATNEHAKYIKKMIKFVHKNPRKMEQKHHQKLYKFYFIYKSPRPMLLTAKNTRNDV